MNYNCFSNRIYVEETSEQCYFGYRNSQKAKEATWWDKYSSNSSDDQQM